MVENGIDAELLGGSGMCVVGAVWGDANDNEVGRIRRIVNSLVKRRSPVSVVALRGEPPAHFRGAGDSAEGALHPAALEPLLLLPGLPGVIGCATKSERMDGDLPAFVGIGFVEDCTLFQFVLHSSGS